MRVRLTALTAALVAAGIATMATAATDMEQALAEGAKRMSAEQIAARLDSKTVTFEQAASGDRFLVYYDGVNGTLLKKVGGDTVMEGFYAVTVADRICFGMKGDAPMRLRCVDVLLIDDMMHKFEADGSLRGRVVEEEDGNLM